MSGGVKIIFSILFLLLFFFNFNSDFALASSVIYQYTNPPFPFNSWVSGICPNVPYQNTTKVGYIHYVSQYYIAPITIYTKFKRTQDIIDEGCYIRAEIDEYNTSNGQLTFVKRANQTYPCTLIPVVEDINDEPDTVQIWEFDTSLTAGKHYFVGFVGISTQGGNEVNIAPTCAHPVEEQTLPFIDNVFAKTTTSSTTFNSLLEDVSCYQIWTSGLSNYELVNPSDYSLTIVDPRDLNYPYYYFKTSPVYQDFTFNYTLPNLASSSSYSLKISRSLAKASSSFSTLSLTSFSVLDPNKSGSFVTPIYIPDGNSYIYRFQLLDSVSLSVLHTLDIFINIPLQNNVSGGCSDYCSGYSGSIASQAICDMLCYLFIPTATISNYYSMMWNEVNNKPPFGYFAIASSTFSNFATSSNSLFTAYLSRAPNLINMINTFTTALLTIILITYIINRFKHIHI